MSGPVVRKINVVEVDLGVDSDNDGDIDDDDEAIEDDPTTLGVAVYQNKDDDDKNGIRDDQSVLPNPEEDDLRAVELSVIGFSDYEWKLSHTAPGGFRFWTDPIRTEEVPAEVWLPAPAPAVVYIEATLAVPFQTLTLVARDVTTHHACEDEAIVSGTTFYIEILHSDQLTGQQCNWISDSEFHTGGVGKDYMMVGARSDNRVYLSAEAYVAPSGPNFGAISDLLVMGLAKVDDPTTVLPVERLRFQTFGTHSEYAFRTMPGVEYPTDEMLMAVVGLDLSGNGQLEPEEVRDDLGERYRFRPVFNSEMINAGSQIWSVIIGAEAINWNIPAQNLRAFWDATHSPTESVDGVGSISATDDHLESATGAAFATECEADVRLFSWMDDSNVATNIMESYTFEEWTRNLLDDLTETVWFDLVDQPAVSSFEYYLPFPAEVDFSTPDESGESPDEQLHLAFGKVQMDATLWITVTRTSAISGVVTGAQLTGQMTDLYDWDWDWHESDAVNATFQAAYPTLNQTGGAIYLCELACDGQIIGVLDDYVFEIAGGPE